MDGPSDQLQPAFPAETAALARYGRELAEAVERAMPAWVDAAIRGRETAPISQAEIDGSAAAAVDDIGGRLRELLALDPDQQWTNPLSIIRQAVAYPTAVLAAAGVAPVERDATDARLYPDDVYWLVPAAFADLGPEVHERGLMWGAAKAHVHLLRRRALAQP